MVHFGSAWTAYRHPTLFRQLPAIPYAHTIFIGQRTEKTALTLRADDMTYRQLTVFFSLPTNNASRAVWQAMRVLL